MTRYDLCLAWNWEHDGAFVRVLTETCRARDIGLLQVTPGDLPGVLDDLGHRELVFSTLLDRASDEDERFLPLVDWARENGARNINAHEMARRSRDKAATHRALFANVHTPYTIIVPSHRDVPELPLLDLTPLGNCFTIKPANGGGGAGVVVSASSLDEVREARKAYPDNQYLLQTRIVPATLHGRPAWFRVIFSSGEIYPCWWSPDTHVYAAVTAAEESHYGLAPVRRLTEAVAAMCKLQLFSTEIALAVEGTFQVVDYVNDPLDLRLQSDTPEGVPDDIVRFIAEKLTALALPG
jgi:hypothetical protein